MAHYSVSWQRIIGYWFITREMHKRFLFCFCFSVCLTGHVFWPILYFAPSPFSLKLERESVEYMTARVNHLLFYLLSCVLFIHFYLIYWFTAQNVAPLLTVLPLWLRSVNTILNLPWCIATMGAGSVCVFVCVHVWNHSCIIEFTADMWWEVYGNTLPIFKKIIKKTNKHEFGEILTGTHTVISFFPLSRTPAWTCTHASHTHPQPQLFQGCIDFIMIFTALV